MFSFGHADRPQFGGVGVMVEPPAVEVDDRAGGEFRVHGALAERAQQFAELAAASLAACRACPRARSPFARRAITSGLGVGTQLGLSVAAGLRRFLELPELPVEALAASVGRGARSAVGTYGFQHGGLIVDAGHIAAATADWASSARSALRCRTSGDSCLFAPVDQRGLAGDARSRCVRASAAGSRRCDATSCGGSPNDEMLPAVERRDCAAFGDAVYRFGRLAGECFAAVQGGPFATPRNRRACRSDSRSRRARRGPILVGANRVCDLSHPTKTKRRSLARTGSATNAIPCRRQRRSRSRNPNNTARAQPSSTCFDIARSTAPPRGECRTLARPVVVPLRPSDWRCARLAAARGSRRPARLRSSGGTRTRTVRLVRKDLARAADIGRHHRQPARGRFQQHAAERLLPGRVDQQHALVAASCGTSLRLPRKWTRPASGGFARQSNAARLELARFVLCSTFARRRSASARRALRPRLARAAASATSVPLRSPSWPIVAINRACGRQSQLAVQVAGRRPRAETRSRSTPL